MDFPGVALLSAKTFCRSRIDFLTGNFTGAPIINFIPESEIVSQSGQQICQKIDVTSQK